MWVWCLAIALGALALAGSVYNQLFWWSMVGSGVLWAVGVVVEIALSYRHERALGQQTKEETPADMRPVPVASDANSAKEEVKIA